MGQEQLIKAIEEEGQQETARIIEEAEADAANIIREANEAVETERRAQIEGYKRESERERAGAINRARTEARSRLLVERSGIIEEVFEEVTKRFEGLPKKQEGELVKRLYQETKKEWTGDGKTRVHLNPADQGLIKDPEVEFVADQQVSQGVVFVSDNGRVRAENTLSSRLKRVREYLVPKLNTMLFG